MPYITQERLRELFDYSDGYFVRKVDVGKRFKAGDVVKGTVESRGYVRLKIDRKNHRYHRVIWIWHFGEIPKNLEIDHKNGKRADNRLENMRLVTKSENQQNRKLNKNNKSTMLGVCWHKQRRKWEATIYHLNKKIYLGVFENKEDAANAYLKAKKELHTAQPVPRFL